MMRKTIVAFLAALFFATASVSVVVAQTFQNQMHLFGTSGTTLTNYINHANQMKYEWVVGDPWSPSKAATMRTNGLYVMWNSGAGDIAKWYRFNNPGTTATPQEPTQVNDASISTNQYNDFKVNLCMTSAGASMSDNDLFDPATGNWKYRTQTLTNDLVIFIPNWRCYNAIYGSGGGNGGNVQANEDMMNVMHGHTGIDSPYSGLWMDEVNPETIFEWSCSNPCIGQNVGGTDPATRVAGQLEYIKRMKVRYDALFGTGRIAGNPFKISNYSTRQATPASALDFLHNEHGAKNQDIETNVNTSNDVSQWGNVNANNACVQLPHDRTKDADYRTAQLIAGRAAKDQAWFGWYGGTDLTASNAATQLLRAIPNWDNKVSATSRAWNESTDVYTSSNSRIDNGVAYSRRWTDGKLFVTWNTNTSSVTIEAIERVVDTKRTDSFFIETVDGSADITVAGTQITLNSTANQLKGYILTLHDAPQISSAVVNNGASSTVVVTFLNDDGAPILPAATVAADCNGLTFKKNGASNSVTDCDRTASNTYTVAVTNAYINGDTISVSYDTATGSITSSSPTNPEVIAATDMAGTNLVGATAATLTQNRARWRELPGNQANAVWLAAENGNWEIFPGGKARLRVKINATVANPPPMAFALRSSLNGGAYTVLSDNCASTAACAVDAQDVAETDTVTEQLTSDYATNVVGKIIESAQAIPTLDLSQNSETENEYAIQFSSTLLVPGDQVCFRVYEDDGTALATYITTPCMTVIRLGASRVGGGTSQ